MHPRGKLRTESNFRVLLGLLSLAIKTTWPMPTLRVTRLLKNYLYRKVKRNERFPTLLSHATNPSTPCTLLSHTRTESVCTFPAPAKCSGFRGGSAISSSWSWTGAELLSAAPRRTGNIPSQRAHSADGLKRVSPPRSLRYSRGAFRRPTRYPDPRHP